MRKTTVVGTIQDGAIETRNEIKVICDKCFQESLANKGVELSDRDKVFDGVCAYCGKTIEEEAQEQSA